MLRHTVFLFPHPLKEIRSIADHVGAKVWCDGAHVTGLIAGGAFQDPLREGADLMTGSGMKTLSGPPAGLIMHNDEELDKRVRANIYGHIASSLSERVPALAVCLAEMLEFGREFAAQIIANAKAPGSALEHEGLEVKAKHKGFTESHTLAVGVEAFGGGDRVAERLEHANIIASPIKLKRDESVASGLRLGVTEMTRFGMKEKEMKQISHLIRKVVGDEENPKSVAEEVKEIRRSFQELYYCFRP